MRKAFTLIEMLVLITIAPLMMVVISGIFATFIRDIPRETRTVQQNATVLDMLRQVRQDMDAAVDLPDRFDDAVAGQRTLLIRQSQMVVCYQFENGRTVRTLLKGQEVADPNGQRVWRTPNAVVTWRPWTRDGRAYAVEMHSHVQQWFADMLKDRLVNSQVFFVQGLGKGREVQ